MLGSITVSYGFGNYVLKLETPYTLSSLTYTGKAQSPEWVQYDSEFVTIGGDVSATNAGTYTTSFTVKSGFAWLDSPNDNTIYISWTIDKAVESSPVVATPALVGTAIVGFSVIGDDSNYIYSGEEIEPVWVYKYDESVVTVSGDTSAVEVGEYNVTFELNDTANYEWDDGTTDPKTVTWEIKAE